jgi:hypothetical protein
VWLELALSFIHTIVWVQYQLVFKKHKKQQRRNNNNNNNALSRSCRNNYHNPNHPDSSMVWLSGTSEPFNHTEKTVNGTGM